MTGLDQTKSVSVIEPKTTVNIHAAKTHLSRLIARAAQGEETVIARNGRPVARLVPYREERKRRKAGRLAAPDQDPAGVR